MRINLGRMDLRGGAHIYILRHSLLEYLSSVGRGGCDHHQLSKLDPQYAIKIPVISKNVHHKKVLLTVKVERIAFVHRIPKHFQELIAKYLKTQ